MKKEVFEGEMMPKGYGYAYTLYNRNVDVFYPFPINYIIAVSRNIWIKVRHAKPDDFRKELQKAYEEILDLKRRLKQCDEERREAQKIVNFVEKNILSAATESDGKAKCDSCHESIDWCDCANHTNYSICPNTSPQKN